ncbi:binding-protein-dependent transport system inner membrane protein [Klebsiella pneumoniae]|uniref:Binding-protein-dependent transport system inner membrane protein n=1 Tax=Klebsiella pneumoniae TaxID=573 RepID=A0A377XN08_KLEPN|nr:binding-protein-dependent transport system inner membrane protein [Klebsiella pneumoniae]
MLTVDMAFRVNSYGDYAVANALGVVSLAICGRAVVVLPAPQPAAKRR